MKFIGRKMELEKLNAEYERDGGFVVIYGRRRVGKTTLIKEFLKKKTAFYFLATEELESQSMKRLAGVVARMTKNSLLQKAVFTDLLDLFHFIADYEPDKKKVMVIDEFPYLVKTNPAFPSILQNAWDEILKDSNVMLILSGSLIGMMQKHALSYDSPLYGRRTAQMRLAPLPFTDVYDALALPFDKAVEQYAVTGGVPKYLEFFEDGRDLVDQLKDVVLSKSGFLYEEPFFLLKSESMTAVNYFSIIKAIADGNHKLGKIAGALGQETQALTPYLLTLADLGFIEKRTPVTEKNPEKACILSQTISSVSGFGMFTPIKVSWNWTICKLFWMRFERTLLKNSWHLHMRTSVRTYLQVYANKEKFRLFRPVSVLIG